MMQREKVINFIALLFGSLNVISSGMVYGWPSPTLPSLLDSSNNTTTIHVTLWQGSLLAIAPFLGALITAPISFTAASFIGPKRTLMFTFYPYITSWIVIAVANSFEMLLFARILAGVSDCCIFNSFPIYIDDICNSINPKRKFYSLYPISFALGILIINLIATNHSLFETGVLASFIIVLPISSLVMLPESPHFLLSKNKPKQAREALRFSKNDDEIDEEYEKLKEQVLSRGESELDLAKVFSAPIRTNLGIGIALMSAQQLSGITPIVFYLTTILKESDFDYWFDSSLSLIIFSLLLAMAIFNSVISDAQSGKTVLLYSLIISSASLISLGLYFQNVNFIDKSSILSTIPVAALLIYSIFYGLGLQNIPYVYMNRMYSRNIKSKCLALVYMYYSVIASLVCLFFTWVNASREVYVAFYVFGGSCLVCFILVWTAVPRCKDWCEEAEWLLKSGDAVDPSYEFLMGSLELSDFSE